MLPINRSTIRHKSRRPDQTSFEMRIKNLAATRVRYGYRPISWRNDYNDVRPHSALGNQTPTERAFAMTRPKMERAQAVLQ